MGVDNVSSFFLTLRETCVLRLGHLECADRFGGNFATRFENVELAAGNSKNDRICVLRTNGSLACADTSNWNYDFWPFSRSLTSWGQHPKRLVLFEELIILVGSDNSSRTAHFNPGTDKHGAALLLAVPSSDFGKEPAEELTTAYPLGGSFLCTLRSGREACTGLVGRETTLTMPSNVVHIGGGCALLDNGQVACFGADMASPTEPKILATIPNAKAIATDDGMGGCALLHDGRVSCFGDLGVVFQRNGKSPTTEPRTLSSINNVAEIAMLDGRACMRTAEGRLSCLGCLQLPQSLKR